MTRTEKIESLEKLVAEISLLEDPETYHREFWAWRQKAMRRLSQIFDNHSLQVAHFLATDYLRPSTASHRAYRESPASKRQVSEIVERFVSIITSLKEEIPDDPQHIAQKADSKTVKKIFISHSSDDKKLVSEIVHLLSLIGVQDSSIFCSSLEGYGIPLGDNWLQTLKSEVSGEVIVLFVLSPNYFESEICLCEMGAAWVLSKKHIPILIPPFDFSDMQGVIPLTQGFKVDNKHRWTELKTELEGIFNLSPKAPQIWESRRDEILERIAKPSGSRSKFK